MIKKLLLFLLISIISFQGIAQTTAIPDPNFEQALIDFGYDTNLDGEVLTSNISGVTSLDINDKNISDLTGIEDFVALTRLYCYNNSLTSLYVGHITTLKELDCSWNSLPSLDVSNNIALEKLYCSSNSLPSLDVSSNTALEYLSCSRNPLTSLDVSSNTALEKLYCHNNSITSLNVSSNTALTYIKCDNNHLTSLNVKNGNNVNFTYFEATNNNLTCVQVDDVAYSTTNWTDIDDNSVYSEDCPAAQSTAIPDPNFEQALIDLGYDTNLDGEVLTSNISTVTYLDVNNRNISNLAGIEDFVVLEFLICSRNSLVSLDVSSNTALTSLWCGDNSITSLDVSHNTALENLICYDNSLTSLDVSTNKALVILVCSDNSLPSLDVSSNTVLEILRCGGNNITNLNLSSNTVLEILSCSFNPLTSLDVSSNTALTDLDCTDNSLPSLDVSRNTELIYLDCTYNSLESLNIKNGNNDNMIYFEATNNNLTCVQVDDVAYSTTNWTYIDDSSVYSEDCYTLSTEQLSFAGFTLYPNPVNSILNIGLQNGATLKQVTVYNNLGKPLFTANTTSINVSELSAGMYFVNVETIQGKSIKKVVVN
ncbi:T9SS type A sorting domain-containing protein [Tamlana haliotis]|uniref:T9SS type A sorting domain-containing protein n=1 Tax=Pseudotamlana haliotis TaxID=2614804 RepID=A0A6N6MD29_9FLAO|nr:T9SS type A sorting domain-containing protein [Tamlana haliotis]KAB1066761.1 T9SS type A sorting domain-containing protein [Tamlana haliotis]